MAKIKGKVLFAIIVLAVIFLPPFAKYQELRYRNKKLENELIEMKREARRLEMEKLRLETDITYVEKKAREKIGVVRKGEIVLKESPK
ncbi:MAG: septum formation initiator family protein [Candidatus Omnitrophota bacterium]